MDNGTGKPKTKVTVTPEMKALMGYFHDQIGRMSQDLREEIGSLRQMGGVNSLPLPAPDEAVTLNDLGVQMFYRNELKEAQSLLERATAANPSCLEAWNNLAMVHSSMGEAEKAIDAFGQALELDPNRTEVQNNQAVLQLLGGNNESALALLEQAVKTNPRHIPILLNLAQAYQAKSEHERAVRAWKMVAVIDPGNEEARQNLRQYFQ